MMTVTVTYEDQVEGLRITDELIREIWPEVSPADIASTVAMYLQFSLMMNRVLCSGVPITTAANEINEATTLIT